MTIIKTAISGGPKKEGGRLGLSHKGGEYDDSLETRRKENGPCFKSAPRFGEVARRKVNHSTSRRQTIRASEEERGQKRLARCALRREEREEREL